MVIHHHCSNRESDKLERQSDLLQVSQSWRRYHGWKPIILTLGSHLSTKAQGSHTTTTNNNKCLLCVGHCSRHFPYTTNLILTTPYRFDVEASPFHRILRHRQKVICSTPSTRKWPSWHLNPGSLAPEVSLPATAKSLQSCPTLWDPRDGSPPGSPVPGILQARTLEWVAISFSNA